MRTPRRSILAAALLAAAACTTQTAASGDSAPAGGEPAASGQCAIAPLETRDPNGASQKPAFEGQTRVCALRSGVAFDVAVVATGLAKPWSIEPLADGSILVTEKPGRMRIVAANGTVGEPIAGVPAVDPKGQGGLLDVELGPNFASDRTIFFSFTEPRQDGNGTSVARAVLSADRTRLENVQVIFRAMPSFTNNMHYGSRVLAGPDGMIYVTLGERSSLETRPKAQDMNSHFGKIVRIAPDGSVPQDNPFVGQQGARPEIWSVGHRNVQAAAFDPQGRLWEIEHGTRGGDELNLVTKGKNYGWPLQAYGIEYNGSPIPNSSTTREGMEQPVYYWDPVIAPSGAQWYTGSAFPAWRGSLFVGGLNSTRLVRLELEGNRVKGEEHLLVDRAKRIRDVKQGPDGHLYVITDYDNGELWRISPR